MWIAAAVVIIIVIIASLFIISKSSKPEKNTEDKKNYAMPKPKRYPDFYLKGCHFSADGSSRFAYSEDEIQYLINSNEDAFKKGDFGKAIKLADEIIKVLPKSEKIWINKINSIFSDVIQKERPWNEGYSKKIINACYGFLQCTDTVLDRSLTAKHTLVPDLIKNVQELIKYQTENVTKHHNFEVYNMLINIYHIIPFKNILEVLSNNLLEDKFCKSFENDEYAQITIKNFLNYVDMLRTSSSARLQEIIDARKITNCTLINDEKMDANIIAFDLNFEPGTNKEKIEARFYNENDEEINFGKKPGDCFLDVFEANTTRGVTIKEEIVILSERKIYKVKVRTYKEEVQPKYENIVKAVNTAHQNEEKNDNTQKEQLENNITSKKEEVKPDLEGENIIPNNDENNKKEEKSEEEETQEKSEEGNEPEETKARMLMYPSFDEIKDIKISDSQFVCLKNDGLVLSIGEGEYLEQLSTWSDVEKIYVRNNAAYAVKNDGSVTYAGISEYENPEYIYAWENIDSLYLADKHMLALTKNATVKAIGDNKEGQCDVDEWYDIVQIAVAFHSVGLTKDGKVKAVGENNFGECDVNSWQDIVQIAAGNFYTIGLTATGKVLATGLNSCGQCNVSEWTNIKQIYACGNITVGLRYDGRVVVAGKTSYRMDDVKKWNRIKNIVVSDNRIVAVEQDGIVWATGKPYKDFVNGNWQDVKNVVLSGRYIVGIKETGKLVSNGLLFGHLLSNNFDSTIQICESVEANKIAMLNDQKVLTLANKNQIDTVECVYPTVYDVKKADISMTHLVALKENGTVSYINFNDKLLTDMPEWDSIVDVKAGDNFIIGLNINGHVLSFGDNSCEQCNVFNWGDVVKIDAAGNRAIGLTIDGKILMSGKSEFGEGDFLKTLTGVKSVVMSKLQIMTLQNDGTVKLTYNPLGVSVESIQSWKDIKKIVVRENNFLGLKEDGTILSTLENEAEISKWTNVEDLDASGSYTWATLKEEI